MLKPKGRGVLDHPLSRVMTSEVVARAFSRRAPPSRGAHSRPSCCRSHPRNRRGRRECRVLAATHGPPAAKKAGGSYHRFSQIIRHSLRDGFNAYSALSLGTGLSCSHRPRDHHLANLASASGGQDHAPSPSASASLVWRHRHVHRSPHSTSVTTRPSLFGRGGMARVNHTFLKNAIEIFCARGRCGEISQGRP